MQIKYFLFMINLKTKYKDRLKIAFNQIINLIVNYEL